MDTTQTLNALRALFYEEEPGPKAWQRLIEVLGATQNASPTPLLDCCTPHIQKWPAQTTRRAPLRWLQTSAPWLTLANTVELNNHKLDDHTVATLLGDAPLKRFKTVHLANNHITDQGAQWLAANLSSGTRLHLLNNPIGQDGAKALEARSDLHWLPADQHTLCVIGGKHFGAAFPLAPRVSIGRGRTNDIMLTDSAVSRRHCEVLTPDPFHIVANDLNSSCGIFVNGQRHPQGGTLSLNDHLMVGHVVFSVRTPEVSAQMQRFNIQANLHLDAFFEGRLEWLSPMELVNMVAGTQKSTRLAIEAPGQDTIELVFEQGRPTLGRLGDGQEVPPNEALARVRDITSGRYCFNPL